MFVVNLVETSFVWVFVSAIVLNSELFLITNSFCIELEACGSYVLNFIVISLIKHGLFLNIQLDRDAWAK